MVLGVDDLRELLRPTAFTVALLSTGTGPRRGRGFLLSVDDGFPTGFTFCPLLSGSDRAELEAASAAHQP